LIGLAAGLSWRNTVHPVAKINLYNIKKSLRGLFYVVARHPPIPGANSVR
jgi:hypothetical protein